MAVHCGAAGTKARSERFARKLATHCNLFINTHTIVFVSTSQFTSGIKNRVE